MVSTLPILVPGRPTPINVPCELPDSFTFTAFLPSRGLREFTAWLTSTDVRDAEVKDVVLAEPETDPRGDEWVLEVDEQQRADEAAGDVLSSLLARLQLDAQRGPRSGHPRNTLNFIALAHEAECKAWEALRAAHKSLSPSRGFYSANPAHESSSMGWVSEAANYLAEYVERSLDEAVLAQKARAERKREDHEQHAHHYEDEMGSERIRAPRQLDAPTLKCLDVDF